MAETIHPASIVEETRRRYLTYALSVISSRALPDVRDGLKPVQRRILYCMYHELLLYADRRPSKSARIVGEVMGKYHPHGDMAIYDALVRLSQSWVMREPMVDGHGNFGSVDGDSPAASRYTEAKLTAIADHLMAELRQHTVPMRPTYDGTREEPVVLPAQFPHLLVNGTSGIAVGMATNIPPHNLGDVVGAAVMLIDNPEATTATLLDKVKGPDFPLGGKIVTDRPTLRKTYEDGQGSIRVQAEWKVEETGRKKQIVVTSIPYGVNKGTLEGMIGEIIAERKLPQLVNLTNETNEKDGMRIALEIKADADPHLVMAYLYKHTALQENFPVNLTCLVPDADGKPQPRRLGLKEILRYFLDFRLETVRKRFDFELEQLRKRIHILEGFQIIFNALDRAIRMIRESDGKADAADKLKKAFHLDDIQVEAILDAQLYKIAQLEIQKILDELKEKTREAEKIEALLRSEKKLWGVVRGELEALAVEFGTRRRTKLAGGEETPEFDPEAYIVKENTNVVLTRDGWIKRVGRLASVEGTRTREGDAVLAVVPGSTLDHVILFADDGTAYTMRINLVPASSGYGEPVAKFFKLADQVKIIAAAGTDERFVPAEVPAESKDDPTGPYLLAVTAQGMTLRTPLAPYRTESNKLGRRYVKLNEGDKVVLAVVLRDEKSLFLASRDGHILHFPIGEINILSGVGKGVIGIKLANDDVCLGAALVAKSTDMLVVETSGGKTLEFTGRHETTARGGKGWEAVKRTSLMRVVPPAITLVDWDELEGKKKDPGSNGAQTTLFE
ncbi:MAG TPA: DNA topoisomerase IV subunit A [Gemmataceae bacterium]|jgi:DNA gyrase subunit A|nr:DNA topoisomerase IV subunit A [Gemmataceae bacterium]